MAKEMDLKKIVSNLTKLGVNATITKPRIELLKVLTPPTHATQAPQQNERLLLAFD